MKLNSKSVKKLFNTCLANRRSSNDNLSLNSNSKNEFNTKVEISAVFNKYIFNKKKIEENRFLINQLLNLLPESFFSSKNLGGNSLSKAKFDMNFRKWTSDILVVEYLISLGMAIGRVDFFLKRRHWWVFMEELPFIFIKD